MNWPSLAQVAHTLRVFVANKLLIAASAALFASLGWGYTLLAQPVYEARALVQVPAAQTDAQLSLMRSIDAVGKIIEAQNLATDHTVAHLTLVGNFFARHFQPTSSLPVAEPLLGMASYGWGGEELELQTLEVPSGLLGETLTVVTGENGRYTLYAPQRVLLLSGQTGELAQANGVSIRIARLIARPGTLLYVARKRPTTTAQEYLQRMDFTKGPAGSGLIYLALRDTRPAVATRLLDAISRLDAGGARVVDGASVNVNDPALPRTELIVTLCALFGMLLAMAWLVNRKVLDADAKGPDAIEGIGLPVLASLPWSQRQKRLNGRGPLLSQVAREDLAMEALRSLRTSLYMSMLGAPNKGVLLTSPTADAGTSFIASNLAVVLAQGGQRVLLVDGNLRRGRLHEELKVRPAAGLADVLAARADSSQLIYATGVPGLDVVASGRATSNPAPLLEAGSIEGLLEQWGHSYEVILIDAPALAAGPDARLLGRQVGTVLLVARMGKYSLSELDACRQRLAHEGVPVRGAVFNGEIQQQQPRVASVVDTYGYAPTPQRKS